HSSGRSLAGKPLKDCSSVLQDKICNNVARLSASSFVNFWCNGGKPGKKMTFFIQPLDSVRILGPANIFWAASPPQLSLDKPKFLSDCSRQPRRVPPIVDGRAF